MARRSIPIRKLPSGRWQARPSGVDPATFETEDDARSWCLDVMSTRAKGLAPAVGTSKITFRAYASGMGGFPALGAGDPRPHGNDAESAPVPRHR